MPCSLVASQTTPNRQPDTRQAAIQLRGGGCRSSGSGHVCIPPDLPEPALCSCPLDLHPHSALRDTLEVAGCFAFSTPQGIGHAQQVFAWSSPPPACCMFQQALLCCTFRSHCLCLHLPSNSCTQWCFHQHASELAIGASRPATGPPACSSARQWARMNGCLPEDQIRFDLREYETMCTRVA